MLAITKKNIEVLDENMWPRESRTTLGGKPPRWFPAAVLASARPLQPPFLPLSPAASCVAPWSPPWLTTSDAFGAPSQPIMAEHDTRTDEALSRLVSTLPAAVAQKLVAQLDEALAGRELLWRNVLSGHHARQDSWGAQTRLVELGAAEVAHTWLWRINRHHGRLRLGANLPGLGFQHEWTCTRLGIFHRQRNLARQSLHPWPIVQSRLQHSLLRWRFCSCY